MFNETYYAVISPNKPDEGDLAERKRTITQIGFNSKCLVAFRSALLYALTEFITHILILIVVHIPQMNITWFK